MAKPKSCKQKTAWLILNREYFQSNITSGGILIIWSQLDCFHCLRVLYWAHNRQLLQAYHVLTYKNQVHKLLFWLIWKKKTLPKNRRQDGNNIKGKRRWCLNSAQTFSRIWTKIAGRSNVLSFLSIWPTHRQYMEDHKTQRQPPSPVLFWSGFNWVHAPPPIFHSFTQESLPFILDWSSVCYGCHYCFTWL